MSDISRVTASREIAGPPQAPACGVSLLPEKEAPQIRAALYVDGFNLYHAVDALKKPHLKWLNLWALGELIIPSRSQKLVRVVYCSARKTDDPVKQRRHAELLAAYNHFGVTIKFGHFIADQMNCRSCGRVWDAPKEKESDVNLALSLLDDAYQDTFDHAYLVTADSDQGATVRLMRERFPHKSITSVAPPQMHHSKSILAHTDKRISLTATQIEKCLLPQAMIIDVDGKPTLKFRRPPAYDPP